MLKRAGRMRCKLGQAHTYHSRSRVWHWKLTLLPEQTEYGMVAIHVGPYWPILSIEYWGMVAGFKGSREQQDSRVPDLRSCQENHDVERHRKTHNVDNVIECYRKTVKNLSKRRIACCEAKKWTRMAGIQHLQRCWGTMHSAVYLIRLK